jgi:uncharacterized protein YbgA (DUF1722 family)/uncharacterized protein YbbK (DUF523 family)
MRRFARPKVVVSQCLGFEACRWNGATIPDDFVNALKPFVDFHTVCPEVEIGLGVPRNSIRIVQEPEGNLRLRQQVTERDVTEEMVTFSERFLGSIGKVDGFILKSRSPSCGIKDSKVYPGMGKVASLKSSAGFFGGAVLRRFPGIAIEDEGRLNNERLWDHFLKRIFTVARFDETMSNGGMSDLVEFQAENKLVLMSYSQKEMRVLGRTVANREKKPVGDVLSEYREHLLLALSKMPRPSSNINVCMHMLGYFSESLTKQEKDFFLESLDRYRNGVIPLAVLTNIVKSWALRFNTEYLLQQTYLEPYPESLSAVIPKGEARELRNP